MLTGSWRHWNSHTPLEGRHGTAALEKGLASKRILTIRIPSNPAPRNYLSEMKTCVQTNQHMNVESKLPKPRNNRNVLRLQNA